MRKIGPRVSEALGKVAKRALEAKAAGDGRPFVFLHLITSHCMCHCQSCLWKRNDWEDVPTEDMKRFYAGAAQAGFVATAFSGGEVYLRKDLGELLRFVKEQAGMSLLLFTTGWFLKERMDETLPYVTMLLLSLDASTAERHDRIRGLPGLFDRLVTAVPEIKKKYPDLSMQFNCCVQKGMEDDIDDLLKLTAGLDMQISFDVITDFRHGAGGSHFAETGMGLPLAEVRGVCDYLKRKKAEGAPILNSERYFDYFARGRLGYKRHFPKFCIEIDGRGNVEDCLDLDHPLGNIRENSIQEIMERPRFKQVRLDAEACSSCNSPTMVDMSLVWENPKLLFEPGGIQVG